MTKNCNLPSEDEDNDVPSEFTFFKTEEESRWETEDEINSPPDFSIALSSVAKMIAIFVIKVDTKYIQNWYFYGSWILKNNLSLHCLECR